MAEASQLERLALRSLQQRCVREGGFVYFRIEDGAGDVRLTPREWERMLHRVGNRIEPSGRFARRAVWLAIPFAIALLAIVANVPGLAQMIDRGPPPLPLLAWLAISCALPGAALVRHAAAIHHARRDLIDELAERPRCTAPGAPPPRGMGLAERLVIILAGPHVFIQLYGSFDPDAYRNTPLSGTQLNWVGVAGMLALVALAAYEWRARAALANRSRLPEV